MPHIQLTDSPVSVAAFLRPKAALEKRKKDAKALRLKQVYSTPHYPPAESIVYTLVLSNFVTTILAYHVGLTRFVKRRKWPLKCNLTATTSAWIGSTANRCASIDATLADYLLTVIFFDNVLISTVPKSAHNGKKTTRKKLTKRLM